MLSTMRQAFFSFGLMFAAAEAQLDSLKTNLQQQLQAQAPCDLLATQFPTQVFFSGDTNYTLAQNGYWSAQQRELQPACRFFPTKASEIQQTLADIIIPQNISIAIASGDQSSVLGASNVASGITFDMSSFKEVNFFLDAGKATWLGVGNRWKDAYAVLENANLTVAGSRSAQVGVGGHVLGGGLSWYSSQYGWAIDSVVEFEVVTPMAEILQVSPIKEEDLFMALKGSAGAFGIVTKLKMKTFPHNGVYGGSISYEQKHLPKLIQALDDLTRAADRNPTSSGYLTFTWLEAKKDWVYTAYLMDTDCKDSKASFPQFQAIPHTETTLKTTTITESAKEMDKSQPTGLRRSKFTLTTYMDTSILTALHDLVKDFTRKITFDKAGTLRVTYEPLTASHLREQNNFFNLGGPPKPLTLVSVEFSWSDAAKDSHFEKSSHDLRVAMQADVKNRYSQHPFIYPGYAAKDQDPYAGLTELNRGMLKAIKKKYDPNDTWKNTAPGVWHI